MAIIMRNGLAANFDPNKMRAGELAIVTDTRELHATFAQGDSPKVLLDGEAVPNPETAGTNGQILSINEDGDPEWGDVGAPTDEQVEEAVSDWLDAHPEATTTVEDGAITYAKLDSNLKGTVDDVGELKSDFNALTTIVDDHGDEIAYLMSLHFDGTKETYDKTMKMWFESQGVNAMTSAGLTELCSRWYKATRRVWNGWTTFYQPSVSDVSTGTKGGDNANLVCEPSTNTYAGRDDYAGNPLFACVDVNFDIDPDTLDVVITAIDGITSNFVRNNPAILVGVMQMSGFAWTKEEEQTYIVGYSSEYVDGKDQCWPLPESVRVDGTLREFVVHSKYMGHWDGEQITSCSGYLPTGYMTLGTAISRCKARGTGHGAGSVLLQTFLILMTYIKYASLTQDGIIQGCLNYNHQYASAIGETGTNRIVITKEQGDTLIVGSGCLLGHVDANGGIDRTSNATVYNISGNAGCIITSIEDVEIGGVTYSAITTDHDGTFDTVGDGTMTEGNTLISTYSWPSGTNDEILGNDGAKDLPGSGIYPAKLQGIEYSTGQYEQFGDVLLDYLEHGDDHTYNYYKIAYVDRASQQSNAVSANHKFTEHEYEHAGGLNWYYIAKEIFDSGIAFASDTPTGSSNAFTKDAFYKLSTSTGATVRRFLGFGTLTSGVEHGGLSCVGGGYTVAASYWYFAVRPSACANRGEWVA